MDFRNIEKNVKLVPMSELHCDMVYEISNKEFSESWSLSSIILELENKYSVTFVAIIENSVIGFINGRIIFEQAYINNIAVHNSYKSNGVGTMLLLQFIEYSKNNNVLDITLEVRKSNELAISFYHMNGFNKLVLRKDYYNNPLDDGITMIHYLNERL